jgi:hypothetical protein
VGYFPPNNVWTPGLRICLLLTREMQKPTNKSPLMTGNKSMLCLFLEIVCG